MSTQNYSTPKSNGVTRLIKKPAVLAETGLSHSSLYLAIKKGEFPPPVRIGKRSVAWRKSDIEQWINSLQSSIKSDDGS